MTKKPDVRTEDFDSFLQKTIGEIEDCIINLRAREQTLEVRRQIRAASQALRQRQRDLKATAMDFEQTNNHHLLVFDSTHGFAKMVGNSVLFYSMTVANRLHRRFKIQQDTDNYSKSAQGVIALCSLEGLEEQLAQINIFPDETLSTTELHYYKLPKVYTDEQLADLHDKSRQDLERIMEIIMPQSPLPLLYREILEVNRLIYYNCKNITEWLARESLVKPLMKQANWLLENYLNFAGIRQRATQTQRELEYAMAKVEGNLQNAGASRVCWKVRGIGADLAVSSTSGANAVSGVSSSGASSGTGFPGAFFEVETRVKPQELAAAQDLFNILLNTRQLKNHIANMENLRLIHHKQMGQILEKLVIIERMAEREYSKRIREMELEKDTP